MSSCIVYHGTNKADLDMRVMSDGRFSKPEFWFTYNKDYAIRMAKKRAAEYHSTPVLLEIDESTLGDFVEPTEDIQGFKARYVSAIPKNSYVVRSVN